MTDNKDLKREAREILLQFAEHVLYADSRGHEPGKMVVARTADELIDKATLAERARCAKVARGFDGSDIKDGSELTTDLMEIMARHIAKAIEEPNHE